MDILLLPVYVIAALVAVSIVVFLVIWWKKTGRRRYVAVAMVSVLIAGVGIMSYAMLRPKSEVVWVQSVVDSNDSPLVMFEAPKAKGYAAGAAFSFESKATPDEVFDAFLATYPAANRVGDVASVMIDGHEYVLHYEPSTESHLPFTLFNEDTCTFNSPVVCALFTNPTPQPLDPDA